MPCDYAVVVVKPLAVGAAVKSWGAVGAGGGGGAVGRGKLTALSRSVATRNAVAWAIETSIAPTTPARITTTLNLAAERPGARGP